MLMLAVLGATAFPPDVRRLGRRGIDLAKLAAVIDLLAARKPLEPRHTDHALSGDWPR